MTGTTITATETHTTAASARVAAAGPTVRILTHSSTTVRHVGASSVDGQTCTRGTGTASVAGRRGTQDHATTAPPVPRPAPAIAGRP